jgi:cytochrome P450
MGTPVDFDPFEPGFDAWPYDQYARLRDQDPVHWSDLLAGWVLTSYDDVTAVLRDHSVSSSLDGAKPSPVVDLHRTREGGAGNDGLTLVLQDDPEHARLRKALQAPFTARSIGLLRHSIEERVDRTMSALAERDEIELIADLAYPLPVAVFCEMLGIPEEEGPRFREWTAAVAQSLDLVISEDDHLRCIERIFEMEAYLAEAADEKRRHPTDDVLTQLVQVEVDGERLTPGELVAQLVTLYVAGHEPTTALIGNGMAALLAHPDQLQLLQHRPDLIPDAVQELLRYDGPNQFVRRTVIEPLALGAHDIDPGDVLYVGVGAANHDLARWGADADVVRVDRPDASQHVQFGGGVHHCLGAHLARAQAEVAFTALLTRLGGLELAGEVTWSGRTTLRSVASVPLRLHR